jgi:hypothetical protein
MKSCNPNLLPAALRGKWLSKKLTPLAVFAALLAASAQAQVTYTPVFTNLWVVSAGTYPGMPANSGNNCRGIGIDPVTTNVLYFSSTGGTNGVASHVGTLAFASGSNYLANLNSTGISGGTVGTEGVRVSDDGYVYGCNLSGASNSVFKVYRWPSDTDVTTAPTIVFNSSTVFTGPGITTSFTWRVGDYMDLRGSGISTEIVAVGNGSGVAITTNFVILRPTDATCTTFTNFSITIPGGVNNLCGAGVAFEGTNNAVWIRQASSQLTRRVAYDPVALTATVTRTNNVDQSVCQGLKYFSSTNGVQMLATVQTSTTSGAAQIARVFQIPASPTAAFVSVLNANIPAVTGSVNGNGLGNVDVQKGYLVFGAPGHGLSFFQLGFITTAPPTISLSASGTTIIQGYGVTNTVTASGSSPFSYQWYFTNGVTTNLISGAITNVYSIASLQASNAGGYFVIVTNLYGKATSGIVNLTVLPNGSSLLATQLWSLAPGSRPYLTTTDTQRGLGYDPVLQRLVLVTRAPTNGILLLDAATGADAGNLDISALLSITPPGTFAINMCGVADDGIVYVGNLLTSATSDSFAIYSWTSADPSASIGQAYAANPGIGRIGDTMAVRGAGTNTEILCSFRTGTNVALFNTQDGVNFGLNIIAITNLPAGAQANGFAGLGLAFGPGNTFWAKSSGFDLRQVTYDAVNGVGGVINDYSAFPTTEAAIGVDNANGYIAAIGVLEYPQSLPIYDLSASGGPSLNSLVDREFFPASNANGNGTGAVAVDVAGGRIFALDSNSGIIALSYAGKLTIAKTAGQQVVTWPTTTSVLQSSTNVAGTYTDVSGATSPYTNSTGNVKFFRLRH